MISGYESRAQVFPEYDDKTVFRSNNLNERAHFLNDNQELNTIIWEANLRRSVNEMRASSNSPNKKSQSP